MKMAYLQVYTGNGKGKTTAALGLALRAAGAGKKVFIAQFVKGMHYGELDALRRFEPQITLRQYGRDCFIRHEPEAADIRLARQGLEDVSARILSGQWDLVILDEACIALHYNLFSLDEMMDAVDRRPDHTEIVITGRYAPRALIEKADLVTEMTEIKHYYHQGIQAREGIEF
ncbi:MAG TPA: cob(I)yrinic acid a,c-diamide adenosyltransferase [Bacteroidales bacterium]|nr:cob(I)yrinic acid a,c-diamide adenosyltransferase [Bacteroidales bacterium]HSA43014.1 cob(I)yrinic acid a,c-diamide adenosyltransferase [Bacteroidales bacterium]